MPEHNALTGSSLHDPKAHASSHADGGADAITSLETLVAAVLMKMSTPYVRFIGTEGSAVDYRLVETAGSMKLQKNTGTEGTPSWSDLVDIDSSGNLNAISLKVGGTEVVDSSGDIAAASVPAAALASGPINASGQLDFDTATELTIASGVITATNNYHTIDTQSDGASDDLDTITAGTNVSAGFVLVVQPANAARTVVLKNGTGGADNLDIGADVTLDESYSTYALVYDGSNWRPFSYAASVTASTISGTLAVGSGGTGATSLTDGGLLLGSGTGAITALGVATNGQIPIGDGSTDPQLANITGTSNEIEITNGSASIQVGIVTDPTLAGSNISALNGSNISSGTVAPARMGSGTPGSGNFLRGDGAWAAPAAAAPDVQRFTGDGTWTKPTGDDAPISVYVVCVGGGGGGGSGEGGAGGFRVGGFGGGGGGISTAMFQASTLGSTVAVTIGVGGSAGSGTASATGGDGGGGGDTTFGGHLKAGGGAAGVGGTGGSNPPDADGGTGQWVPIAGTQYEGRGRGTPSTAYQDSSWGAGGGGRGGCISGGAYMTAGDRTVTVGGAVYAGIRAAGSAGTNGSSAGGAGAAAVDACGGGGGGGGAHLSSTSYAGGAGGNFGGGGGGSGAGSGTSAAGGAGAAGYCLVISFP